MYTDGLSKTTFYSICLGFVYFVEIEFFIKSTVDKGKY